LHDGRVGVVGQLDVDRVGAPVGAEALDRRLDVEGDERGAAEAVAVAAV
jgi:hypothetical protein